MAASRARWGRPSPARSARIASTSTSRVRRAGRRRCTTTRHFKTVATSTIRSPTPGPGSGSTSAHRRWWALDVGKRVAGWALERYSARAQRSRRRRLSERGASTGAAAAFAAAPCTRPPGSTAARTLAGIPRGNHSAGDGSPVRAAWRPISASERAAPQERDRRARDRSASQPARLHARAPAARPARAASQPPVRPPQRIPEAAAPCAAARPAPGRYRRLRPRPGVVASASAKRSYSTSRDAPSAFAASAASNTSA